MIKSYLPLIFFLINTGFVLSPPDCLGSMFVDCLMQAEVLKIYPDPNLQPSHLKVKIRILSSKRGGLLSQIDCSNFKGVERDIELSIPKGTSANAVVEGRKILVHHHYADGRTAAGVDIQDLWELESVKSLLLKK